MAPPAACALRDLRQPPGRGPGGELLRPLPPDDPLHAVPGQPRQRIPGARWTSCDAYNGLGPATRPRDIRYRAALRAQQSEAEMDCILRRAAALGMQYGEYMIYLKTQGEKQP